MSDAASEQQPLTAEEMEQLTTLINELPVEHLPGVMGIIKTAKKEAAAKRSSSSMTPPTRRGVRRVPTGDDMPSVAASAARAPPRRGVRRKPTGDDLQFFDPAADDNDNDNDNNDDDDEDLDIEAKSPSTQRAVLEYVLKVCTYTHRTINVVLGSFLQSFFFLCIRLGRGNDLSGSGDSFRRKGHFSYRI